MGTSYQITLQAKASAIKPLKKHIADELENINQLMSTYLKDSELSLFNNNHSTACQKLSTKTVYVIRQAVEVSKQTAGKFDATVAPLIKAWGFDSQATADKILSAKQIKQLLENTGYQNLQIKADCVAKKIPELSINLSAIAKGYAVDQLAQLIQKQGIENYLIEIGGEIANRGVNAKNIPWKIGIELPTDLTEQNQQKIAKRVIQPDGLGMATSGDYRNYFTKNGKRYSHTIDPVSGYPVEHQLASATVLHEKTLLADAYATALMVMGESAAIEFADKMNLPVLLLLREEQGFRQGFRQGVRQGVREVPSQAFKKFIE